MSSSSMAQTHSLKKETPYKEGGMARISTAFLDDGRKVIVKRIQPSLRNDPGIVRLFEDEIQLHRSLQHNHIVECLGSGKDEQGQYLIFECIEGITLDRLIVSTLNLTMESIIAIAIALCQALEYAHQARNDLDEPLHLIHRDVSPTNVLLSDDGQVKLLDFGVASSILRRDVTVLNEMKGKYAYMAPEQTRGEIVDARSDLFSLGVVLWELTAGKHLFDGPTHADILQAVRITLAPSLSFVEQAPSLWIYLVDKLLKKDPEERYTSANECLSDLMRVSEHLAMSTPFSHYIRPMIRLASLQQETPTPAERLTQYMGPPHIKLSSQPSSTRMTLTIAVAALALFSILIVISVALWQRTPNDIPHSISDITETTSLTKSTPTQLPSEMNSRIPDNIIPKDFSVTETSQENKSISPISLSPSNSDREKINRQEIFSQNKTKDKTTEANSTGKPLNPEKKAPLSTSRVGYISLSSKPWGQLWIDGVYSGRNTPILKMPMPIGRHKMEVRNPLQKLSATIELTINEDQEIKHVLQLVD